MPSQLKEKTLLIINQTRLDSTENIPGSGFYNSLVLANHFKLVIFLCFSNTGKFMQKRIHRNHILVAIPFNIEPTIFSTVKKLFFNYIRLFQIINRLTKRFKVDLIYTQNILIAGIPTFIFCKYTGIPYIISLVGYERKVLDILYNKDFLNRIFMNFTRFFELVTLKSANFVFTISEELLALAKSYKLRNSMLIKSFIDVNLFDRRTHDNFNYRRSEDIHLLFAGRFVKEKGLNYLMKAANHLWLKKLNFKLYLVGDGDQSRYIINFIKMNRLENKCQVLGKRGYNEMPELYHMSDIFILPSLSEGMPSALLEAMASGCACICTNVGMIPKIITNGTNGIVIEPRSVSQLEESIQSLLENPENIRALGLKARSFMLDYSKSTLSILTKIFQIIINRFGKTSH
jgi:glycosyltransferase involved in cell wall biosynthesis